MNLGFHWTMISFPTQINTCLEYITGIGYLTGVHRVIAYVCGYYLQLIIQNNCKKYFPFPLCLEVKGGHKRNQINFFEITICFLEKTLVR